VIGAGALIMKDTAEGEVFSVRGTKPLDKKSRPDRVLMRWRARAAHSDTSPVSWGVSHAMVPFAEPREDRVRVLARDQTAVLNWRRDFDPEDPNETALRRERRRPACWERLTTAVPWSVPRKPGA
jgi:hypothetical protein